MMYFYYGIVVVAAYLLGGVSIANWLSLKIIGKKINEVGSGNTGASNMIRNCGWAAGIGTLVFDAAKAYGTMWITQLIFGGVAPYAASVAGVFVIVGHIWPIWVNFKGGKGVACTLGAMLYLMPLPTLGVAAVCVIATLIFKTMSITSFVGLVLMLAAAFVFYFDEPAVIVTACVIFIITLFTHRANIGRLIKGQEARVKIKDNRTKDKEKVE